MTYFPPFKQPTRCRQVPTITTGGTALPETYCAADRVILEWLASCARAATVHERLRKCSPPSVTGGYMLRMRLAELEHLPASAYPEERAELAKRGYK